MSEHGAREYVPFVPALNVRSRIAAWCSVGLGFCSFLFLQGNQDVITSFGFSLCLTILGIVCFRWWTSPVHPGLFNYFSPHAIILLHFFIYFGPGNLLPLAFPEQIVITYGSQDYYLPTLMIAILGAVVFDFCYRFLCRWLKLNRSLEECVAGFYSPRIQASIAPTALVWFVVCTAIFLYMSRTYLMMTFRFVGVAQTIDTTYSTAGPALLGVAWGLGSLLLWRQQAKIGRVLVTGMLVSLLPIYLAYQNRRLFLYSMVSTLMAYLFVRVGRFTPRKLIGAFALMAAAFVLISMAKVTVTRADYSLGRYTQEEKDIFSRAQRIVSSPDFLKLQPLEGLLQHNARERMAGLEVGTVDVGVAGRQQLEHHVG
ncbi:MAG TPA: hypothetical protein PK636_06835, partial [bacterium]|nr:hypothetical protein [bacterium]